MAFKEQLVFLPQEQGSTMPELILLVDDDRQILDGYRRSLRGEFLMDTVLSGQEALNVIQSKGPYAVVI